MFMKFVWGVGLRIRNIALDFGTSPDADPGPVFNFSIIEKHGISYINIKYKLKELRMNVYDMFWGRPPSDNERRWRRFELLWVLLVLVLWTYCNVV